jgi:hypothetical protein
MTILIQELHFTVRHRPTSHFLAINEAPTQETSFHFPISVLPQFPPWSLDNGRVCSLWGPAGYNPTHPYITSDIRSRDSLVPWAHRSRTEEMQILGMKCRGRQEQGGPRNSALSKGFVGGREDGRRVWEYTGARSKITFAMETAEDRLRKAEDGDTVWNAFWSVSLTIFC